MELSIKCFTYNNITSPFHNVSLLSPPSFSLKKLQNRDTTAPLLFNNKQGWKGRSLNVRDLDLMLGPWMLGLRDLDLQTEPCRLAYTCSRAKLVTRKNTTKELLACCHSTFHVQTMLSCLHSPYENLLTPSSGLEVSFRHAVRVVAIFCRAHILLLSCNKAFLTCLTVSIPFPANLSNSTSDSQVTSI